MRNSYATRRYTTSWRAKYSFLVLGEHCSVAGYRGFTLQDTDWWARRRWRRHNPLDSFIPSSVSHKSSGVEMKLSPGKRKRKKKGKGRKLKTHQYERHSTQIKKGGVYLSQARGVDMRPPTARSSSGRRCAREKAPGVGTAPSCQPVGIDMPAEWVPRVKPCCWSPSSTFLCHIKTSENRVSRMKLQPAWWSNYWITEFPLACSTWAPFAWSAQFFSSAFANRHHHLEVG